MPDMHESPLAELSPILYQLLLDVAPGVAAYSLLLVNSNSHNDMVRTIYSEKQKSEVRYPLGSGDFARYILTLATLRVIVKSEVEHLRSRIKYGNDGGSGSYVPFALRE
jgi:hypothetical protein